MMDVAITVLILVILIASVASVVFEKYRDGINRKKFINSQEFQNNLKYAQSFIDEISELRKGYFRCSSKEKILGKYKLLFEEITSSKYRDYQNNHFQNFCDTYSNLNMQVVEWNKNYVASEVQKNSALFDNIDGKQLDEQQCLAVVVDEDNNLVLAGAGSGKTLTIAAKVKYLVDKKNVAPKDILLVAFTNKAADEMTERISNQLFIKIKASTFHKLGLDAYSKAMGYRPDVFDDLPGVIDDYFKRKILNNKKSIRDVIEFFGLYVNTPTDYDKIVNLGQAIEREKNLDLQTIKSKIESAGQSGSRDKKTLQGEKVKSIEEAIIANHLYLNGVAYEYEKPYPYDSEDKFRKRYRPDFYLPDYDLYLEHFGIDEKGQVPWLPPIEAKKYIEEMKWKKEFHKKNGTRLLETYSYFNKNSSLPVHLDKILRHKGIKYKEVDYLDIYNKIVIDKDDRTYSEFRKLVSTFLNLFKAQNYDENSFSILEKKSDSQNNIFMQYRAKMFLSIIKPLFIEYQKKLREQGYVDFNDMINLSTDKIKEGKIKYNYKYIIIDEYQDISVSRFRLIKAIKDQTNAVVMAVGDDWQSIYRFAGSDIDLFTSFSSYLGHSEILKIERTYRNSKDLIDIAERFILKNPKQLKKRLTSPKRKNNPIRILLYGDDVCEAVDMALKQIVKNGGNKQQVYILGRNNFDFESFDNRENITTVPTLIE